MLIDLLNSQNYIMVNMDAINIFGLNTAVYCAELLNVYKKAVIKEKIIEDKYFRIDREYIAERTSISIEEQLKCDLNLVKVNIINRKEEDPDVIVFNVEVFASLLSSEDVKLLDNVAKKVKVEKPKGINNAKKEWIIANLKNSVVCSNAELLQALRGWIDTICNSEKGYLSEVQIRLFKDTLDKYSGGDLDLALNIVREATVHAYRDCQWAINSYERSKQIRQSNNKLIQNRTTTQKKTNLDGIGDETF